MKYFMKVTRFSGLGPRDFISHFYHDINNDYQDLDNETCNDVEQYGKENEDCRLEVEPLYIGQNHELAVVKHKQKIYTIRMGDLISEE